MPEKLTSESKESTNDSDDSSSSRITKKKSTAVVGLGGLTAERLLNGPIDKPEVRQETLWERLDRFSAEKKAEKSVDADSASLSKEDTVPSEIGETIDVPLETLSPEEAGQTVQLYAEARIDAVRNEFEELPLDSQAAAEAAADMAFLQSVQDRLHEDPSQSIADALDSAEQAIVEAAGFKDDIENIDGLPPFSVPEQRQPEATDYPDLHRSDVPPLAAAGGNGLPPDVVDKFYGGGSGGSEPVPVFGDSSGGGGSGESRAFVPRTPGASMLEAVPAGLITTAEAFSNERTAMGRGVLTGAVVGYLLGRRGGRKRTEKKLLPIQNKLEKQVAGLHQQVATMEQKVRSRAAEKVRVLPTKSERQKYTEKIIQSVRPASEKIQTTAEKGIPAVAASEARASSRESAEIMSKPERLGRYLVEAPLAAAVLGGSKIREVASNAVSMQSGREIRPKTGDGVDLSRAANLKPVEKMTAKELGMAAEHVKIEGVSLKELQDSKRIGERAVRRIMTEYLRGGNISEILSKELLEKELKYERDPRMKATAANHIMDGGGLAIAAAIQSTDADEAADQKQAQTTEAAQRRPVPDAARIQALKRQQINTIATITGIAAASLLLLFLYLQ